MRKISHDRAGQQHQEQRLLPYIHGGWVKNLDLPLQKSYLLTVLCALFQWLNCFEKDRVPDGCDFGFDQVNQDGTKRHVRVNREETNQILKWENGGILSFICLTERRWRSTSRTTVAQLPKKPNLGQHQAMVGENLFCISLEQVLLCSATEAVNIDNG